jgi:translation elongation factor EF-G
MPEGALKPIIDVAVEPKSHADQARMAAALDIRFTATVPLAEMFGYDAALGGRGGPSVRYEMNFERYAPVPHAIEPDDGGFRPAAALRA